MSNVESEADIRLAKSHQVYSRSILSIYDLFVLGFSNKFAWKCSKEELLAHYNHHVSAAHLDVGVGSGYLVDHCQFPAENPRLGLMDINQNCLDETAKRVSRYQPATYQRNILEPIAGIDETYDSIGLNYVLHCVPGDLNAKGVIFSHLKPLLNEGGVLFGSTLLSNGIHRNLLSRFLMGVYNYKGIFNNSADSEESLRDALGKVFKHVELRVVGCVALFSASDKAFSG